MAERVLAVRIDEELHSRIKIHLAQNNMTLKDYVINLITADLAQNEGAVLPANLGPITITMQDVLDFFTAHQQR